MGDIFKFLMTHCLQEIAKLNRNILGFIEKTKLLGKNCCIYFLVNFWKHLGYFLFQHLVTLLSRSYLPTYSSEELDSTNRQTCSKFNLPPKFNVTRLGDFLHFGQQLCYPNHSHCLAIIVKVSKSFFFQ